MEIGSFERLAVSARRPQGPEEETLRRFKATDLMSRISTVGHGENQAAVSGAADGTPNPSDRTSIISIRE